MPVALPVGPYHADDGIPPMTHNVATLLEIRRKANGEIPASLISAAYRASRSRPVMLVLDAVSPREVDQVLDPVVMQTGRQHRGVVYATVQDEGVLASAAVASRVYASSDRFREKLNSRGIAFEDVTAAELAFAGSEPDSQ